MALPFEQSQDSVPEPRQVKQPAPLPPTIASPPSPEAKPSVLPRLDLSGARKRSKLVYILPLLLVIAVMGFIPLYTIRRSQCPNLKIECSAGSNSVYCRLLRNDSAGYYDWRIGPAITSLRPMLALQVAELPKVANNVRWSASSGQIRWQRDSDLEIDTTGLISKEITVKATFTPDSWICSNTASTVLVAR